MLVLSKLCLFLGLEIQFSLFVCLQWVLSPCLPRYNGSKQSSQNLTIIGLQPAIIRDNSFELVTEQQPLTPNALVSGYMGSSPAAYREAKRWHDQRDLAHTYLEKAAKKIKKYRKVYNPTTVDLSKLFRKSNPLLTINKQTFKQIR